MMCSMFTLQAVGVLTVTHGHTHSLVQEARGLLTDVQTELTRRLNWIIWIQLRNKTESWFALFWTHWILKHKKQYHSYEVCTNWYSAQLHVRCTIGVHVCTIGDVFEHVTSGSVYGREDIWNRSENRSEDILVWKVISWTFVNGRESSHP